MKKLLFLSLPLLMAGAIAFSSSSNAAYADFEGKLPIFNNSRSIPPIHSRIDIPGIEIPGIGEKIFNRKYQNNDVENLLEGQTLKGAYSQFIDINGVSSYLGYGYNVITSPYMQKDYVRIQNPIIDMDKILTSPLIIIKENNIDVRQFQGQSMEEFMQNYSIAASVYGNYGKLFSGGIKAEFSSSEHRQKLYHICKTQHLKRSFNIYLGGGATALKEKLSEPFQRDLATMSPAQLFHNYGTHVIAEVAMGGRAELNSTYSSETADYTTDVSAAINAHVKYLGSSINTEMEFDLHQALSSKNVNEETGVKVLGGASLNMSDPESMKASLDEWYRSFDEDLSVSAMCGIVGDQSLIPLWDLVDDDNPDRKEELEEYFVDAAGDAYDELCETFKLDTNRYVTTTTDGNGTVEGNRSPYRRNQTVTLKAVPNPGYIFEGWYSGNELVSSFATYSFDIKCDTNLKAKFVSDNVAPNGSEDHPYLIKNATDLRNIQNDMFANYRLASNISLSGTWTPFRNAFRGTLDGNGYTISYLNIQKSSGLSANGTFIGLFESLGRNSKVCNLKFNNPTLYVQEESGKKSLVYGGLICGVQEYDSVIENCTFTNANVTIGTAYGLAGVVTGFAKGAIKNCKVEGFNVYGHDVVGGIAGTIDYYGSAENCEVYGYKNGDNSVVTLNLQSGNNGGSYRLGGIAGYLYEGFIRRCKVTRVTIRLNGTTNTTLYPAVGELIGYTAYATVESSTTQEITREKSVSCGTTYYYANYNGRIGRRESTDTYA